MIGELQNAKYTLLSNGHCNFIDQHSYKSLFLSNIFINHQQINSDCNVFSLSCLLLQVESVHS